MENIYFPPLQIELIKKFVKIMDKTGDRYNFFKLNLLTLVKLKIKDGNFSKPSNYGTLESQREATINCIQKRVCEYFGQ